MSALCHKRTSANLFDQVIDERAKANLRTAAKADFPSSEQSAGQLRHVSRGAPHQPAM
jgi:hypothetical protein